MAPRSRTWQAVQQGHGGFLNTFYEKYGFYPGDGCAAAAPANVAACTGTRNGILDTANEQAASLSLLQTTGILTNADIQSVSGQPWSVAAGGTGNTLTNVIHSTVGGVNTNAADARYVCQLDRMMDDGVYNAGIVRIHNYTATTDCWSLSGQSRSASACCRKPGWGKMSGASSDAGLFSGGIGLW